MIMIQNTRTPGNLTGNLTSLANATLAGANMSVPEAVGRASLALMEAQLASMTSQAGVLQAQLDDAEMLSAKVLRLSCSVFVFLMQLGFSLIEAGTVRYKNTRNIMIKNVLDTCISAGAFWVLGYAIAFGEGSMVFGWKYSDGSVAYGGGQDEVQFFYSFVFCATSATIFAGAVAERTQLLAYLLFNFFVAAIIYPVIAHVLWSPSGALSPDRGANILGTNGVLDNAGSMVVHVTGGVTSLVGAWMVGPRLGRYDIDGKVVPFRGHSMVFIAFGTIVLWTGFFGFNSASVEFVGQNPIAWIFDVGHVCFNTAISGAAAGSTVWLLTYSRKEPTPEDTFNGVIGGCVAACATSSLVEPYAALVIGIVAGMVYLGGVWLCNKLHVDDPVQATACHLFCGSWGGIAVGFFATPKYVSTTYKVAQPLSCGIFYGCSPNQLGVQILGLLAVYAWVGVTSFLLFYALSFFNVLRVRRQQEEIGLDVAFHGGDGADEAGDPSHVGDLTAKRFAKFQWRGELWGELWARVRRGLDPRECGQGVLDHMPKGALSRFPKRDVWYRGLESTQFGQFSLAMYEANYVMEDAVEVEASYSGVYIGVHDGHSGCETAEFLRETLYNNLKSEFLRTGGTVSAAAIQSGFLETERQFAGLVREEFEDSPHLATVGACSAMAVVTPSALWVANVGDCRVVLGQVRSSPEGLECRAVQLTVDHNLASSDIRQQFVQEHADMPDAVTEKNGKYRVKGKVMVTRAFGDLYLKSHDFNREPLFPRFRVAEPFNPPLLTCEPHVTMRILSPHDSFLIVASDGLFEHVTNQEAVNIVATNPRKDVARKLIRAALQRAAVSTEMPFHDMLRVPSGQRRVYHDDITVVVFFFDHEGMKKHSRNSMWSKNISFKGGSAPSNGEGLPSIEESISAHVSGSDLGPRTGSDGGPLSGSDIAVGDADPYGEKAGGKAHFQ